MSDNPQTTDERDYLPRSDWDWDCRRWHSRVLVGKMRHWCPDWDYLPIDETCSEFEACTCER
jgi:hypothetical protein